MKSIIRSNLKRLNNKWFLAFIINFIIFCLMTIIIGIKYESNDDYSLSIKMRDSDAHTGFVNYFLSKILILLQHVVTEYNMFVIFQICMSFICFLILIKKFLETQNNLLKLLSVCIMSIYMIDHYISVQFTKTSALLLITGTIIVLEALIDRKGYIYIIVGAILVYLGAFLRFTNIYVAFGFAGSYVIIWVLLNIKDIRLNIRDYLNRKQVGIYILSILLIILLFVMNSVSKVINTSTPELKEYSEYNSYRSAVVDYPVYEKYNEGEDDYQEIGISENDICLISSWYLDYDGAASLDNLKAIASIYDEIKAADQQTITKAIIDFLKGILQDIKGLNSTGIHLIILICMAVFGVLMLRPHDSIYIIVVGALAILYYIYLYYVGRPIYRATYIVDLGATIYLLYYFQRVKNINAKREIKINGFIKGKIAIRVLSACVILITILLQAIICHIYLLNTETLKIRTDEYNTVMNYVNDNHDKTFVFSTTSKTNITSPYYFEPIKIPDKSWENNVVNTGGWTTKSPDSMHKLKKNGLNNVFGDIIDNKQVYVIDMKDNVPMMEEYYNKWYKEEGKVIKYRHVTDIESFSIYQVVTIDKKG